MPLQASQEEIQRAYKLLAFRFHPDRLKTGDSTIFARITKAYELIQTPVSRALYDMESGLVAASPAQLAHVHRLRRLDAVQALRLMFNKAHQVTAREQECDGLLIVQARYGDLSPASSQLLDVTMQLQASVADSLLILRGGGSKSWLEGWYDPTEGGDNELDVVYSLHGVLHRVRVGDEEELQLPQPEHAMTDKERKAWEREFRLRSVDLQDVARKRNRRYAAYATLATVAIGTAVYCHHRSRQHTASSSAGSRRQQHHTLPPPPLPPPSSPPRPSVASSQRLRVGCVAWAASLAAAASSCEASCLTGCGCCFSGASSGCSSCLGRWQAALRS